MFLTKKSGQMIQQRVMVFVVAVTVAFAGVSQAQESIDIAGVMEAIDTGDLAYLNKFLEDHSDNFMADLVASEVQRLQGEQASQAEAASTEEVPSTEDDDFDEEAIFALIGPVTYETPLAFGSDHIIGKTLPEIIELSPAFPPIEGLPEEVWAESSCGSCHQWTREALCTQAQVYIDQDPSRYRTKSHPFGGALKVNLRNWAMNDCR